MNVKKLALSMNTKYSIVGVIIKDKEGNRYKFRNPNYEHVKKVKRKSNLNYNINI